MSEIVIAGNTSGSVTITAPDVAGTTTLTLPATSGALVTDNGSGTITASAFVGDGSGLTGLAIPAGYEGLTTVVFRTSGVWTPPSGITKATAYIVAGGGGGAGYWTNTAQTGNGGWGGYAIINLTNLTGEPITITVGGGGAGRFRGSGYAGGASSIEGYVTCNGGAGGYTAFNVASSGASGTASVIAGEVLESSNASLSTHHMMGGNQTAINVAAQAWNIGTPYKAGASGPGTPNYNSTGGGGVGGGVIIQY